ncbi:MAG TPA: hypothetical protein VD886_20560 [Herpetosiphonaceae bacterium]|nr:hypothetical protein [Herpetosiphonaceae bacterium]
MRFARLALMALWLLAAGLVPAGSAGAAGSRCFAETGHCIEGRFLEYWEQNGGLAVFGLPIGAAGQEVNRDTGATYLTQWFERARFELHPENAAPYDVLLGRLGADQWAQNTTLPIMLVPEHGMPPEQRQPQAGCRWFPETRFNVCNEEGINGPLMRIGFLDYWESHGLSDPRMDADQRSLALLGLPITGMFLAYNSSGDFVLMQYFERARLEFHRREEGSLVLQGRLGAEVLHPMGPWQLVRSRIPAAVPVYQPGWLPADHQAPTFLFLESDGGEGCDPGCYTLAYQGKQPAEQLAFVLNDGYQGWGGDVIPPGMVSEEPITVAGAAGTLRIGSFGAGDTAVQVYIAVWESHGQTYRVSAESPTLTRDDLLRVLANLQSVK